MPETRDPSAAEAEERDELASYHFALPECLGIAVARLEREMGTKELAQWLAYDRYRAGRQEQVAAKARLVVRVRGREGPAALDLDAGKRAAVE